jgi:hypothetical protein
MRIIFKNFRSHFWNLACTFIANAGIRENMSYGLRQRLPDSCCCLLALLPEECTSFHCPINEHKLATASTENRHVFVVT